MLRSHKALILGKLSLWGIQEVRKVINDGKREKENY